jgi:hypothetical protein
MSLFDVHGIVNNILIDRNNKIGGYNLYVVNARFHLNVFCTQVRVSLISQNGGVTVLLCLCAVFFFPREEGAPLFPSA